MENFSELSSSLHQARSECKHWPGEIRDRPGDRVLNSGIGRNEEGRPEGRPERHSLEEVPKAKLT